MPQSILNTTLNRRFINIVVSGPLLCLFVITGAIPSLRAQNLVYPLNTKNVLPDNHVCYSLVDQLGYLWIAMPKGVVKYNGYAGKAIGTNEGLPTDDVWFCWKINIA